MSDYYIKTNNKYMAQILESHAKQLGMFHSKINLSYNSNRVFKVYDNEKYNWINQDVVKSQEKSAEEFLSIKLLRIHELERNKIYKVVEADNSFVGSLVCSCEHERQVFALTNNYDSKLALQRVFAATCKFIEYNKEVTVRGKND